MDTGTRQINFAANHTRIVYACFFVSGLAALIYELSWQRLLLRVLGSTLPAVTIVLCVFMSGLAIGCLLAGTMAKRVRNPLFWYGLLELVVGVFGLVSPWLFNSQPGSVIASYDSFTAKLFGLTSTDSFDPFNSIFWCRALFSGGLLLIPTTAMGATFPFVSLYLEKVNFKDTNQGNAYLANLSGAAFGTVVAGFFLLPTLGLSTSVLVASALSIIVSIILCTLFKEQKLHESTVKSDQLDSNKRRLLGLLGSIVLINGAVGMSLEVVWSRLFSLLVGNSTYSIASVLAVSIVGLVLGTALFQKFGNRIGNHKLVLAILCAAVATCLYFDLWLIQLLPWLFNLNHELLANSNTYFGYLLERILVISLVVLPASTFCGGIFPVSLHSLANSNFKSNALGWLYVFSSIGSVMGAALTGFVFIPLLGRMVTSGMECTICILIAVEVAISMILIYASLAKRVLIAAPTLVFIALLVARPAWNKSLMSSGIPFLSLPTKASTTKEIFDRVLSDSANNKLLFYREGLNSTVTVTANVPQNIVYLKNDGKVEAALPLNFHKTADTSDLTTHFMLGKLPLSVDSQPDKHVFVIGLGSGATCGGALAMPNVGKLKVAEIEPTIFEINHFFELANGDPLRPAWLASGKVVPFCGDARMCLNFGNEKFDAIISQPAEPWVSGSSDLYTREFWQLAKSKLTARGSFCQWIQLYAIDPEFLAVLCRTFQTVFPNTYVFHVPQAGEIILLGTVEPLNEGVKNSLENMIVNPDSLSKTAAELGKKFDDFRLNTDDNLLTEYALPQRLYLSESLIDENLRVLGCQ